MDSISQLVLGASVGEAVLGRKEGNKAILIGAIAGTIPDLDVLSRPFLDAVQEVTFHRSISHSLIFCIAFAPAFAWLVQKIYKKSDTSFWDWTKLAFWCFITHVLLDCFTTWGTQVFWPFDYRVAWQSVFVVDPLYTLPFIILVVTAMFFKKESDLRFKINNWALVISSLYLCLTLANKAIVHKQFRADLEDQGIEYQQISARPAPFQNILWTANVKTEKGFHIGYYSILDRPPIPFDYIPKNEALLKPYERYNDVQTLKEMTKGYYAIEKIKGGIIFKDLRFGRISGWQEEDKGPWAFAYKVLDTPEGIKIEEFKPDSDDHDLGKLFSSLWKRVFDSQ